MMGAIIGFTIFLRFIIFIGVIIAVYVLFGDKIKNWSMRQAGKQGEKSTDFWIRRIVKRNGGVLLRNVRLPLYEKSTEIDMIVISAHGILCIENKHVSGVIRGKVTDKYWEQKKSLFEKKKMYNPIMQNEGHIKCLNYHLKKNGLHNIPIFSYVVFSNENAVVKIKDDRLGTILKARGYLKRTYFENNQQIDENRVLEVINKVSL